MAEQTNSQNGLRLLAQDHREVEELFEIVQHPDDLQSAVVLRSRIYKLNSPPARLVG